MCQKQSRKISFSPKKRERPINKFFNQENIFCVPTAIYGLPSALLLVRQIFCLIIAQMYVPLEGSSRFFVHTYSRIRTVPNSVGHPVGWQRTFASGKSMMLKSQDMHTKRMQLHIKCFQHNKLLFILYRTCWFPFPPCYEAPRTRN